ncbi:MAG TPA: hypothetical protein VFY12_10140, partial [Arenimonas sp.]|nr:hypothetical protein [Arenimonas sp.]
APVVGELRAQRSEADRAGNDVAGAGRAAEAFADVLPPPPESFVDEHVDQRRAREAMRPAAEPASAPAAASPILDQLAKQQAVRQDSAADPGFDSRDVARVRNDQKLPFKSWVTRIHRRIDEGDLRGARASLALLRERHPQQRIPVELLDRLRE